MENEENDIDLLNDETFGDGAVEYDWEASHFSKTVGESHDQPKPLHHDDVIIKAVPLQVNPVSGNNVEQPDELLPQLNQLKIKKLWPSSPKQASPLDSIWSSPQLPLKPNETNEQARSSPSLPPGCKAVTLEELEREYLTPSPSSTVASHSHASQQPPANHTPQSAGAPPPGIPRPAGPSHLMGPLPPPMPMGQVPPMGIHRPHAMIGWGMPPHGRFPVPPGYPPPQHRVPLPNVPIRSQQGRLLRPHHPFGPPLPSQHQQQQPPPYPHYPPPHHHHGPHHHPHHMHGWSHDPAEAPRKSRRSEYLGEMRSDGSGFMTQKEKEWVIRIQLLQLQSPDPTNDDYYYQNFMKRKLLMEQKRFEQQSHDNSHSSSTHSSSPSSDITDASSQTQLLTLPQVERKERNYRPIEFQGTLGKVTPSTISAPRKTIDVPLSSGSGGGVGETAKDIYTKRRQTLAVVEKLYLLVLQLEGMEQKALSLPQEERAELIAERDDVCREMFSLMKLKTLDQPWSKGDDLVLQLLMGYRKGKRVMKRVLPLLSDEHANAVLVALARNLPTIMKKDASDQVMPELGASVSAVVSGLDLSLINLSLSHLLSSISGSSTALLRVLQGEFGASLVLQLIQRGRKLAESAQDVHVPNQAYEEWITVTKELSVGLRPHQAVLNQSSSKSVAALLSSLSSLTHMQH